jgi:hypothetical protein
MGAELGGSGGGFVGSYKKIGTRQNAQRKDLRLCTFTVDESRTALRRSADGCRW